MNVPKIILFGMMLLNLSFFIFGDAFVQLPYVVIISSLLTTALLIILYRIYFREDTFVDSAFFSVDRVRSIRFALGYFVIMVIAVFILISTLPFSVSAIIALVILIVLTIINFFILVINFLGSLVGIGFGSFIDFGIAFAVFNGAIDVVIGNGGLLEEFIGNIVISLIFVATMIISSFYLGKYIEDESTGYAISMWFTLIMQSIFLVILGMFELVYSPVSVVDIFYPWPMELTVATPLIIFFVMRSVFRNKDDDFELPEVSKWVNRLMGLLSLALSLAIIGSFGFALSNLLNGSMQLEMVTVVSLGILMFCVIILQLFMSLWIKTGDFSVDVRLFEIEYREELLQKAQEFREME